MLLDRSLYERLVNHAHHVIGESLEEQIPFPHILIKGVFPTDVFQQLLTAFPSSAYFTKANPKHHTNSLVDVGTEFYSRSFNPMSYLREPRGFTIAKAMPFLPNHAYAFSVLNDIGLKSWHGRSTIPPMNCVRNTLLHIWYAEPDETDRELAAYQKFLRSPVPLRKSA